MKLKRLSLMQTEVALAGQSKRGISGSDGMEHNVSGIKNVRNITG